jgi:hypothetical protein
MNKNDKNSSYILSIALLVSLHGIGAEIIIHDTFCNTGSIFKRYM